ncbi:MerR family transcriptional regulator [Companilactobacillus muriivasis]|uniref:MerR family transcriptional regulator n=1 Tax=Companilactobacillus muriivasis TaxID=3081444 RepID=UPI0030C77D34
MLIKEVSDTLGVRPETIRYWEKVGLVHPCERTESGYRDYDEVMVEWIRYIKCLRAIDVPIKNIKKYIDLFAVGDSTITERKNILIEQRDSLIKQMNDLQMSLDFANHKIDNYENMILPDENKFKTDKITTK